MIFRTCHKIRNQHYSRKDGLVYRLSIPMHLVVSSFLSWRVGGNGKHSFSARFALKQSSTVAMVTDVFTVNNTLRQNKAVEHTARMLPSR